ncbi:hypothetical protein [Nonomuraea aridisoli]|uniref:Uncharacterized protein n=1 Tax=Nonomuraea aridisoli TaxID=2070368 RepID=A0A2W2EIM4_9ACTN|nr:hypothetical protein [Nonomuraea aridisoli]PZG13430.1 hypothetical protein C1J01_29935 [Nonomuraea aridisoli]
MGAAGPTFETETISMAPVWRCATAAALVAVLGGCSTPDPGPTAEQAGRTLQQHITELMKMVDADETVVTDPGGKDVPCGTDGVKRTYAVKSTFARFDDNLIAEMAGRLGMTWAYEVHDPYKPGLPRTTLKLASSRTSITLETPSDHEAVAKGETDCIPRG